MKKKEKDSLKNMSEAELRKSIRETERSIAQIRISRYSKQSKNVRETRGLRRKIAVAQTILRQKQLS